MFVSDCLSVNESGHLAIGGRDTVELAATYGTPLYVMDENEIRSACRRFKKSIDDNYSGNGLVTYASKAFCCKAICRVIKDEGMGLDVVSAGELYTALFVGFPPEKIYFHGSNKSPEEIGYALRSGVGRIVVDNIYELELLSQMALSTDKSADIFFRIKPGIDAHTHDFVKTGSIDSKFGFALETGEAFEAVKKAIATKNINLRGIHCHIGSQIFDIEPFELAAKVMLEFIAKIKSELNYEIEELDLGGGFGIRYIPGHDPSEYEKYMESVSGIIKKTCCEYGIKMPFIIIEPGRSIVGSAGITLYSVGGIKEIPGVRTYVSVDGGMTDNPRYSLYGSVYDMIVANKAGRPKTKSVTIAGRCCETDLLGENIMLEDVRVGDVLAVMATGAYNYSMASNYNRIPRPAVVMIKDGEAAIAVRRETMEDMARCDV